MDPSHLGKAERGERLPSWDKVEALAQALDLDLADVQSRYATAKLWLECDGDPRLLAAAATLAHEHAGTYLVNKPANKLRAKK